MSCFEQKSGLFSLFFVVSAACGHLLMSSEVNNMIFVFPEPLLVLLAATLSLYCYNGYGFTKRASVIRIGIDKPVISHIPIISLLAS